jgi:hypothetical protein
VRRVGSTGDASAGWRRVASVVQVEQTAAFLFGALLVGLVAGSAGGLQATTHDRAALATLSLGAVLVLVRRRVALSAHAVVFLVAFASYVGWIVLSAVWTTSVTSTVHEVQLSLAYLGAAVAALVLVRRETVRHLFGGVLLAIALVDLYALGTRVLPDRFGGFDSAALGYRLAAPITYWNGLGLFSALGILLALGIAVDGRRVITRAASAASLPVLAPTMYFTFSRGAWVAIGAGLAVFVGAGPGRLRRIAETSALAPLPVIAVALSSSKTGLTTRGATLAEASSDGHALVPLLGVLAGVAALVTAVVCVAERRVRVPNPVRRAFAVTVIAALVASIALVWTDVGSPSRIGARVVAAFRAPPHGVPVDVSFRLFQLTNNGRLDLWRVGVHAFERHPLEGNGAGTYWQLWARDRPIDLAATEGHSLYIETMAELGAIGLAFLAIALAVPLVGFWRIRRAPLAPTALAVYIAWLLHAGSDWDWELVGASLPAVLAATALLVPGRPAAERDGRQRTSWRLRVPLAASSAVLAALSFVGLQGDLALASAKHALGDGRYAASLDDARRAARWAPWSSEPWRFVGDVRSARGETDSAAVAYRRALTHDRSSWLLWDALSAVAKGPERTHALQQVKHLNPRWQGQ